MGHQGREFACCVTAQQLDTHRTSISPNYISSVCVGRSLVSCRVAVFLTMLHLRRILPRPGIATFFDFGFSHRLVSDVHSLRHVDNSPPQMILLDSAGSVLTIRGSLLFQHHMSTSHPQSLWLSRTTRERSSCK